MIVIIVHDTQLPLITSPLQEEESSESPSDSPRERLSKERERRSNAQDIPLDKATPYSRRVSSSGESDSQELAGSLGSGTVRAYSMPSRSDSLGRNTRPSHHLHKRYGSNESVSSQSTLVKREPYEEIETSYGIMDMIGPELGHGRLTQSRINAHARSEARKHHHHGGSYRRAHAELGGEEYDERREMYSSDKGRRRQDGNRGMGQIRMTPEDEGMYTRADL